MPPHHNIGRRSTPHKLRPYMFCQCTGKPRESVLLTWEDAQVTKMWSGGGKSLESWDSGHYALRSSRVVLPVDDGFEVAPATVVVRGEKIVEIARDESVECEIRDLGDLVIFPGVVDAGARFGECPGVPPGSSTDCWEGFSTGTRAAAAGGVTTTVDLASLHAPLESANDVQGRAELAARSASIDVALAVRLEGCCRRSELEDSIEAGAVAAAAYLTPPSAAAAGVDVDHLVDVVLQRHQPIPIFVNAIKMTTEELEAASPFRHLSLASRFEARSPLVLLPLCQVDDSSPAVQNPRGREDDGGGDDDEDVAMPYEAASLARNLEAAADREECPSSLSAATERRRGENIWEVTPFEEDRSPSAPKAQERRGRSLVATSPTSSARRSSAQFMSPPRSSSSKTPLISDESSSWVKSLLRAELATYAGSDHALSRGAAAFVPRRREPQKRKKKTVLDQILGVIPVFHGQQSGLPRCSLSSTSSSGSNSSSLKSSSSSSGTKSSERTTKKKVGGEEMPAKKIKSSPLEATTSTEDEEEEGAPSTTTERPSLLLRETLSCSSPIRLSGFSKTSIQAEEDAPRQRGNPWYAPISRMLFRSHRGESRKSRRKRPSGFRRSGGEASGVPPTSSKKLVQVDEDEAKTKKTVIPSLSKGMFVELLDRGSETAELPPPSELPRLSSSEDSLQQSSFSRGRQLSDRKPRPSPIKIFKENDQYTRRAVRQDYSLYCDNHRSGAEAEGLQLLWNTAARKRECQCGCNAELGMGDFSLENTSMLPPTSMHVANVSTSQTIRVLGDCRDYDASCVSGGFPPLFGGVTTASVACHNLLFAEEDVPYGATVFKVDPPIRHEAHRRALWTALRSGTLRVVTSGHSPVPPEGKPSNPGDFSRALAGSLVGANELFLPAFWTAARREDFDLADLANLLAAQPATLLRIASTKGFIRVGADADFCIFDPDSEWTVEASKLVASTETCCDCLYDGKRLTGKVVATILRGRLVFRRGQYRENPHGNVISVQGRLVRRSHFEPSSTG